MTTPETLHIQLLGELAVSHGDQRLTLPPSKKTRALLAYLVLTERAHRRDRLCQLFWDVTDDPRGALRWSLSKLRPVLEPDGEPRLVAERESVRFERRQCTVDALALRDALRGRSPSGLTTEELERLVERYEGELLEGLELPDFDDYQAWCLAEREELRVLRADMLRELVSREEGAPQRVLAHARRWVSADPLNESARAPSCVCSDDWGAATRRANTTKRACAWMPSWGANRAASYTKRFGRSRSRRRAYPKRRRR